MYKVYVKGADLAGVKVLPNGWQLYLETEDIDHANQVLEYMQQGHDVVRLDPGETEEDIDWEYMGDDYTASTTYTGNMPCDNYGMIACSSSCPQYYQCNG